MNKARDPLLKLLVPVFLTLIFLCDMLLTHFWMIVLFQTLSFSRMRNLVTQFAVCIAILNRIIFKAHLVKYFGLPI